MTSYVDYTGDLPIIYIQEGTSGYLTLDADLSWGDYFSSSNLRVTGININLVGNLTQKIDQNILDKPLPSELTLTKAVENIADIELTIHYDSVDDRVIGNGVQVLAIIIEHDVLIRNYTPNGIVTFEWRGPYTRGDLYGIELIDNDLCGSFEMQNAYNSWMKSLNRDRDTLDEQMKNIGLRRMYLNLLEADINSITPAYLDIVKSSALSAVGLFSKKYAFVAESIDFTVEVFDNFLSDIEEISQGRQSSLSKEDFDLSLSAAKLSVDAVLLAGVENGEKILASFSRAMGVYQLSQSLADFINVNTNVNMRLAEIERLRDDYNGIIFEIELGDDVYLTQFLEKYFECYRLPEIVSTTDGRSYGSNGNDLLLGSSDNDDLNGGNGDDTLEGGLGSDIHNGGNGSDWVSYNKSSSGVSVDIGFSNGAGGDAAGDSFMLIENVTASNLDDDIGGSDVNNIIQTWWGQDRIWGRGGVDRINGGGDADWLYGEAGGDVLGGDHGNDNLIGGVGDDWMWGGDGSDAFWIDLLSLENGGHDRIMDFQANSPTATDWVRFEGVRYDQVIWYEQGGSAVIQVVLDGGGSHYVEIMEFNLAELSDQYYGHL